MTDTHDFQDRGDTARRAQGIDGTAGDAQDVPHRFVRDPQTRGCLLCGLARSYRKHTEIRRTGNPLQGSGYTPAQLLGAVTDDVQATTSTSPHDFTRKGWRFWICRLCYAPRALHPRTEWVHARPLHRNDYLSANAPHFEEGW